MASETKKSVSKDEKKVVSKKRRIKNEERIVNFQRPIGQR